MSIIVMIPHPGESQQPGTHSHSLTAVFILFFLFLSHMLNIQHSKRSFFLAGGCKQRDDYVFIKCF